MPARSAVAVLVFVATIQVSSVTAQQFTRSELGITSSIIPNNRFTPTTDAGIGGRFTYNFTPSLALETEGTYYLTGSAERDLLTGGRAISFLAGPKAGIRKRKFGIFFKSELGVITFSDVFNTAALFDSHSTSRRTHAAMDLGGVAELYPSSRLVLRLDAGAFLVRYGDSTLLNFPSSGGLSAQLRTFGLVSSPYHLVIGAGYRLGSLATANESETAPSRVQLGVQYSLQTLQRDVLITRDESSIGGWLTYNLGRHFGLDAAASFFPREMKFVSFQQGGQMIQALAGLRWGVRRDHWGVFAKFRPGVQIYTLASGFDFRQLLDPHQTLPTFANLAFDSGGVFEFYTSKHTMLRFEAGDTQVHFRKRHFLDDQGNPFTVPSETHPSIQLTMGFGLRF
jgi:hypothetical protein